MKFRLRLFATAFFIMISSSVHSQKEDRELFKNASCYYEYALKRNNDPFYLSKSDFYCDQAIKKSSDTQLIASLRILKNKIALKFLLWARSIFSTFVLRHCHRQADHM